MSNTREPDNGVKPGSGWEDRQGLVPNEHPQAPEEALGSLPRLSESPKKAGDPDAAADSLTASHRRHSLGGAMTSSRAPRTPRFFFGRSSSLQEGAEQAGSGGASQGKSMFGRWKRKGDYSALENQVRKLSRCASCQACPVLVADCQLIWDDLSQTPAPATIRLLFQQLFMCSYRH